jgi:hypothetical protein
MGRREGPREGYKLLEAVRAKDKSTPFFIYAGSNAHQREAALRGAQGSTNVAGDLVDIGHTVSFDRAQFKWADPRTQPKPDPRDRGSTGKPRSKQTLVNT